MRSIRSTALEACTPIHYTTDGDAVHTIYRSWGVHANNYTTDGDTVHTIYRTWGVHANHYTTDGDTVHKIYRTWGVHANNYTTDGDAVHTIYHTWGVHANHYTTDSDAVRTIYHTWGVHANITPPMRSIPNVARVIQWNLSKPKLLQTNLIVFGFTLLYLRRVTDLRVNQAVFIHVLTILRIHIVELLVR
jgi:hypothetical protein